MSIDLCILASGSGGNCSLLRTPAGTLLIDAGIGPRTAARRMEGTSAKVADISAIVITHADSDHFNLNWARTIVRQRITVHCHLSVIAPLASAGGAIDGFPGQLQPFNDAPFEPLPHVRFSSIPFAHDRTGSHGFVIEAHSSRLGYATDLGHVPDSLFDHFGNLDLLAIESNYDPQMQRNSGRPWFLQNRIMGGAGHLSNEQALDAIRRILNRSEGEGHPLPRHIVLLHRSRQCNCPDLMRQLFSRDRRIASRLTIADQFEPTGWLRPQRLPVQTQLTLAFA